ncbi:protein RGF1 INDUCIBLE TRANSCRIPTION FACTOR 1 [Argentina anserina]|uniref:protein RGF1 INDUCIBLE TRANSCRIPTION FACTOR 1 n=1 Tax=Argentina anserina TaxID=57926 RepID=UPI0021767811|nr:protein RGF1 INDUCIBLE TRANSCRIPTION FACTOR 1 [Potentilla anserina]
MRLSHTPHLTIQMEEEMLVPSWLESLLSTTFFSICPAHRDAPRSECNMYCLDCRNAGEFCFYCRSSRHKDHQVIQIRRSSYHDVVRVNEIQKVLDITGVQTYVINSARVLFLNERPQPRTAVKGSSHICEVCGRSLLDPFRFCSLGCKLVGLKQNGDASFIFSAKNGEENEEGIREGIAIRLPAKEGDHLGKFRSEARMQHHQQPEQDMYQCTPPPPQYSRSRRRKGIPHRAPLGP